MSLVRPIRVAVDDLDIMAETDRFIVVSVHQAIRVLPVHGDDSDKEYVEPHVPAGLIPWDDWVELMTEVAFNAQDDPAFKKALEALPAEIRNLRLWLVKKGGKLSRAHQNVRAQLMAQSQSKLPSDGLRIDSFEIGGNVVRVSDTGIEATSEKGSQPAQFEHDGILRCALWTLTDKRIQQLTPEQYAPFLLGFLPPPASKVTASPPATPAKPAAAVVLTPTRVPVGSLMSPGGTTTASPQASPSTTKSGGEPLVPAAQRTTAAVASAASVVRTPVDATLPHEAWSGAARAGFKTLVVEVVTSSTT